MSHKFNKNTKHERNHSESSSHRFQQKSGPDPSYVFSGNRLEFEKLNNKILIEISQCKRARELKDFITEDYPDGLPAKFQEAPLPDPPERKKNPGS